MNARAEIDWPKIAEAVVADLLGEPNRKLSKGREWRYGARGSLSIDLDKATWFDNEKSEGGGLLALVERETGRRGPDAIEFLAARGLMDARPIDPQKQDKPKVVARYPYRDEQGRVLFEVRRFEPKDFRPFLPDGNGWKAGRGKVRVPYRLPELLAADTSAPVFIPEGEKDVDALRSLGLVATCNDGGAGKWPAEFARYLQGRRVVILPDNDEPGRGHSAKVKASLAAAGVQAAILDLPGLPPKGDVSDWLKAGGTAADLLDRAKGADKPAKPVFELVRASDMRFVEPEFAIDGLLETDTLSSIFGRPGAGKSFVAIDMACCIATGTPYHGRDVRQGTVVYIAGEGHNGLKRRQIAWERRNGKSTDRAPLYFSKRSAALLDEAAAGAVLDAIRAAADAEGSPPQLVVIDTLARNFGPGDENSTKDMSAFVSSLDGIKAEFPGCCVMVVHHSGHGDGDRGRGSSVFLGALDAEYRVSQDAEIITVACTKMKEAEPPEPFSFQKVAVEVGRNRMGEPVMHAALAPTEGPPPRKKAPSKSETRALEAFNEARKQNHGDDLSAWVEREAWREAFYRRATEDGPEAKKKAFQRAQKALVEAGLLTIENDKYRLAKVQAGEA